MEVFWLLSILPLLPVFFFLVANPPIFGALLFLVLLYRIGLIRIYGYFRPNWEETDPRGSVISEAMDDLTQPVEDFVDEVREDVCLLYTSPSPRDKRQSRMPSSA